MAAICFVLCQMLKYFLVNLYLKTLETNKKAFYARTLNDFLGLQFMN